MCEANENMLYNIRSVGVMYKIHLNVDIIYHHY